MTNGFLIVYCPPVCEEAWPLSDLAHVGSIVFGILLALVAIWSLWRARARPGWFMPALRQPWWPGLSYQRYLSDVHDHVEVLGERRSWDLVLRLPGRAEARYPSWRPTSG